MRSHPAYNTLAARRAQWIKAQKAALGGPSISAILRHALHALVPVLLLALWTAAVLVRVFLKDRVPGAPSYFYYATPPAVLAGAGFAASLWWFLSRPRLLALLPLVLGVACLVWAYLATWVHNRPAALAGATKRVLFWNVAHGSYGWPRVIREIRRRNPDIVALVEAGEEFDARGLNGNEIRARDEAEAVRTQDFWTQQLPEYTAHAAPGGIVLLARDGMEQGPGTVLGGYSAFILGHYTQGTVRLGDGTLRIVLVDLGLAFGRSLWPTAAALAEVLNTLPDQPVLIVGDFNSPTDSIVATSLRANYTNAFEAAGNGYAATWPMPVPVLTIDQAWFNHHVQVARCEFGWTWASDHRCIELEVGLPPEDQ